MYTLDDMLNIRDNVVSFVGKDYGKFSREKLERQIKYMADLRNCAKDVADSFRLEASDRTAERIRRWLSYVAELAQKTSDTARSFESETKSGYTPEQLEELYAYIEEMGHKPVSLSADRSRVDVKERKDAIARMEEIVSSRAYEDGVDVDDTEFRLRCGIRDCKNDCIYISAVYAQTTGDDSLFGYDLSSLTHEDRKKALRFMRANRQRFINDLLQEFPRMSGDIEFYSLYDIRDVYERVRALIGRDYSANLSENDRKNERDKLFELNRKASDIKLSLRKRKEEYMRKHGDGIERIINDFGYVVSVAEHIEDGFVNFYRYNSGDLRFTDIHPTLNDKLTAFGKCLEVIESSHSNDSKATRTDSPNEDETSVKHR